VEVTGNSLAWIGACY